LTHHVYGVIILRSLSALPFHPAGGDVRLSLDQVILLLSLVGGSIYATASLTIKILEHLQKKKDLCPNHLSFHSSADSDQ